MDLNGVHAKLFPSVADDIEAARAYFGDAGFELTGWTWMLVIPNGHPIDMEIFTVGFCSASGKWRAERARGYENRAVWVSPDFDDPVSAYVCAETCQWGM